MWLCLSLHAVLWSSDSIAILLLWIVRGHNFMFLWKVTRADINYTTTLLYRTTPMPGSSFSSPNHQTQQNKYTTQRLVHETEGGTLNHTRAKDNHLWVTSGAVTRMCGFYIRAEVEGKQNPSFVFKPLYPFSFDYSYGKCLLPIIELSTACEVLWINSFTAKEK